MQNATPLAATRAQTASTARPAIQNAAKVFTILFPIPFGQSPNLPAPSAPHYFRSALHSSPGTSSG